MSTHHMVVVDAARSSTLTRWEAMLAKFVATPGDSTVSVLAIDDSGVRTMLAATSVRTAPPSLKVPPLSGHGPRDVAHELLRAVIHLQVQLDEPVVHLYMLTDPARDEHRLKELRRATNVRIRRDPLHSAEQGPPRRLRLVRNVAILACVVVAAWWGYHHAFGGSAAAPAKQPPTAAPTASAPPVFIGPEAQTAIDSGWNSSTVRSVPPGKCVTQYPYPSRLNAADFAVVDCTAATALMKFVQVDPITDPSADPCPQQSPKYFWDDGGSRYCFVAELRTGMCVPVRAVDDGFDAYLGLPASCRDPIALDGRLSPDDATGTQLLQIDSVDPTGTAPPCVTQSYVLDDVGLSVCAHLLI